MLSFERETSRPATGARPPVGSHMRGGGVPRNLISSIRAALLDALALIVIAITVCCFAAGFGASVAILLFVAFPQIFERFLNL